MAFGYQNHWRRPPLFLPAPFCTKLPCLDLISEPLPPFGGLPSVSSCLHIISCPHFPASFFFTSPLLFICLCVLLPVSPSPLCSVSLPAIPCRCAQ